MPQAMKMYVEDAQSPLATFFDPFLRYGGPVGWDGFPKTLSPPSLRSDEPTGLRPVPRDNECNSPTARDKFPNARPPGPAPDRNPLEMESAIGSRERVPLRSPNGSLRRPPASRFQRFLNFPT